jgi:hypothetical protein
MVMNKLQKGLKNSRIPLRASRLNYQKFFFKCEPIIFFDNSDRDFYYENNNVSQLYTYIPKIKKKVQKRYYRLCSILR